jgi:glyoxylase-like metal-dependent hydrolase (beta-lactamase superfamily II)
LSEGDVLKVGTATFTVIETPGHTEGGIVLLGGGSAQGIAFVGDTLFAGSCGRTDLLGGDHATMMDTLARLKTELPAETAILCGHGPASTMEVELATNPWLQ